MLLDRYPSEDSSARIRRSTLAPPALGAGRPAAPSPHSPSDARASRRPFAARARASGANPRWGFLALPALWNLGAGENGPPVQSAAPASALKRAQRMKIKTNTAIARPVKPIA